MMSTSARIDKLQDRYPFNKEELELLVRCYDHLSDDQNGNGFVLSLAKALPYSTFFLPGDELKDRIGWIEDTILPQGFSGRLHRALTSDVFVDIANQGDTKSLEKLIEGIADASRRGSQESLWILYDILGEEVTAERLIDLCVRLDIASEALVVPFLQKEELLQRMEDAKPCIQRMSKHLEDFCEQSSLKKFKRAWIDWAETYFPGLSTTLSIFMDNLMFHGHLHPPARTVVPYGRPALSSSSAIFDKDTSPSLLSLSFMNKNFGGKWHRLYSSDEDGFCFNRLEWSLLGFSGPTVTLIKTTQNEVIGAYASAFWKDSEEFTGDSCSFLFQLEPTMKVFHAKGSEHNFAYLHTNRKSQLMQDGKPEMPRGFGFGGKLGQPRLFIPESFEGCIAGFLDDTFEEGRLVSNELEKFEISVIEIWSVNGEEAIKKALQDREEYRERHQSFLESARVVQDKSQFVRDFEVGLIPNSLYDHKRHARGRQEFRVDEDHGGYTVDRE